MSEETETETEPTAATNTPSAARLSRVETVLSSDPTLKAHLGKKTVKIKKRGGTLAVFCPEVVAVATAMQSAGIDPCASGVSKADIIDHAKRVFSVEDSPVAVSVAATSTDAEEARPARSAQHSHPTVNHNLSVYTLLLSAIQLARHEDRMDGASDRLSRLEEAASEFRKTLTTNA